MASQPDGGDFNRWRKFDTFGAAHFEWSKTCYTFYTYIRRPCIRIMKRDQERQNDRNDKIERHKNLIHFFQAIIINDDDDDDDGEKLHKSHHL